jgi:RNA polymerase sigma factor (sigma-70 family)
LLLRDLGKLMTEGGEGNVPDAVLLERFVKARDEAAFEVLVWRHGPMVLALCQRLLRDRHAAEDAFQATFLVLACRATSIGKRASVGSWLHKVAYRIALRARAYAVRQPFSAGEAIEGTLAPAPSIASVEPEFQWVLDEALARLPEKYRTVVVRFYLQGQDSGFIARELGCPIGTVTSRLARARQLLRLAAVRHGLVLTVPLLVSALAPITVPAMLVADTLRSAALFAAGRAAGVKPGVALLAQGVIRTMFLAKLKITGVLVAVLFVLGLSTAGLYRQALAQPQGSAPPATLAALTPLLRPDEGEGRPGDRLLGRWRLVREEVGNKTVADPGLFALDFSNGDVVIQELVHRGEAGGYPFHYRLDAAASPLRLDWSVILPGVPGPQSRGILAFRGEQLILAMAPPDQNEGGFRPTEFRSDRAGVILYELRREIAADVAWGDSVDGVRFGLMVTRGSRTYKAGETVTWLLKMQNQCDREVVLQFPRLKMRTECWGKGCWPTVRDARGQVVDVLESPPIPGGKIAMPEMVEYRLPPRATILHTETSFSQIDSEATPGDYQIGYDGFLADMVPKGGTGKLRIIIEKSK